MNLSKLKLPKSMTILGRKYKVIVQVDLMDDEGVRCEGLCDFTAKIIHIDAGIGHEEQLDALAHEARHIALHVTGKALTMTEEQLEMDCQTHASTTMDFIKSLKL